MASRPVVPEPAPSPGPRPLSDDLLPDSIFAPERSDGGIDTDQERLEDGDPLNGEPGDRGLDLSSKVGLDPELRTGVL